MWQEDCKMFVIYSDKETEIRFAFMPSQRIIIFKHLYLLLLISRESYSNFYYRLFYLIYYVMHSIFRKSLGRYVTLNIHIKSL